MSHSVKGYGSVPARAVPVFNAGAEKARQKSAAAAKLSVDYSKLTVKELRSLAKDLKVSGYSSMNKEKLVEALSSQKKDSNESVD